MIDDASIADQDVRYATAVTESLGPSGDLIDLRDVDIGHTKATLGVLVRRCRARSCLNNMPLLGKMLCKGKSEASRSSSQHYRFLHHSDMPPPRLGNSSRRNTYPSASLRAGWFASNNLASRSLREHA
jgi:hypothetical protein